MFGLQNNVWTTKCIDYKTTPIYMDILLIGVIMISEGLRYGGIDKSTLCFDERRAQPEQVQSRTTQRTHKQHEGPPSPHRPR